MRSSDALNLFRLLQRGFFFVGKETKGNAGCSVSWGRINSKKAGELLPMQK